MPLYDFRCDDCQTTFEELIRSSRDEAEVRCSSCGSSRVERQLSSFAMGRGKSSAASASTSRAGCSGGSCGSCHSSCCH